MSDPFLAMIWPMSMGGGAPTHPIAPGGPPPSVGVPGFPTPPMAPGGQPPVVGGGPVVPPEHHPDHHPEHPIAPPPPQVGHPIAPGGPPVAAGDILLLIYIPGTGFKWVVVDTSLKPTNPIVIPPATPPTPTPNPAAT